ncbi:hypothetical protein HJ588_04075 [Flexivirga sp. ID2601S]|uniref:Uncharacterized protein n=1 Tax=Flexivirga aerilata TaxID=1656889 RepID=A0A849ANS3_9MICO|nr:DUF6049 family protein [Flexivirga aerilata]NNG38452.1 hypothetical protein [Flexivirga aerilata]
MSAASSRPHGSISPALRSHLLAVVLTALLVLLPFGMPGAAHAATDLSTSADIRLAANDPVVAARNSPVTVSGSITNTGGSDIQQPVVRVSLADQLLDTHAEVDAWSEGRSRIATAQVASGQPAAIAAGQTVTFSVTIPAERLRFSYGLASLPMTVAVTDDAAQSGSAVRGTTRTTLEFRNGAVTAPLQVSVVVPLTLPADPALYGPSGGDRVAAWRRAIGPDSRIQQTLDAFAGLPVTWAIDPEVVDPPVGADDNVPAATTAPPSTPTPNTPAPSASSSAAPSATESPRPTSSGAATSTGPAASDSSNASGSSGSPSSSGSSSSSSPSSASSSSAPPASTDSVDGLVAGLKQRLTGLDSAQSVWWLPWDDPDLGALRTAGSAGQALATRDLSRGILTDLRGVSTQRVLAPVGTVPGAAVTAAARKLSGTDKAAPIALLPSRALPVRDQPSATARVAGTSGVLAYDESLSATFGTPSSSAGQQANLLLAELMATYQQSPGTARSLALLAPRTGGADPQVLAAQVRAMNAAPWVNLRTGSDTTTALRSAPVTTLLGTPRPGPPYPRPEAPAATAALLDGLPDARRRLTALQSILVDSNALMDDRRRALDVIGSTRWRGNASAATSVADRGDMAVTALLDKVSVRDSTINFFANSGDVTVTVINDLNRAVHDVTLTLQPRKYQLKVESPSTTVQIRANSRGAAKFGIKAVGSGNVPIDVLLSTPQGTTLPSSDAPAELTVNVRPTSGWIMWVLGALAVLVLIFGLRRALRRGPRTASAPAPAGSPARDDAIVDAGERVAKLPDGPTRTTESTTDD